MRQKKNESVNLKQTGEARAVSGAEFSSTLVGR